MMSFSYATHVLILLNPLKVWFVEAQFKLVVSQFVNYRGQLKSETVYWKCMLQKEIPTVHSASPLLQSTIKLIRSLLKF